ncbi:AIPR family protein [Aliarcobacter butzleri]|uniref:AIPR family protein n=1 Tax=Aliarcobacter butzleri TaxID=28197 RepID=UPI001260B9E2|nr:AIPR family protein [Aliarcobacter butzleri]
MKNNINKTELNKLRAHIDKNKQYLDKQYPKIGDNDKKHTIALSMAVLIDYFRINQQKAYESITDGGEDNKIDAFYYSEDQEEINELIIIQSKYKNKDAETSTFTEDDIKLCIKSCIDILNGKNFQKTNNLLQSKLDAYRELLKDNGMPAINIKLLFVTNGIIHEGHKKLDEVKNFSKDDNTITFIDATKYGNNPLIENGELVVNLKNDDDKTDSIFSYSDDMEGKLVSCSILELMKFYEQTGTALLLNNNVRFKVNRSNINKDIEKSFLNDPKRFCFLNNGITLVCTNYKIQSTGTTNNKILLMKPSIVNGGQTISTLYDLYEKDYATYKKQFNEAKILIRIYKSPEKYILDIAKATNSQNPINIVDLHSNDDAQTKVKEYFKTNGIGLITKVGEDTTYYDDTITNEGLLQIYASLYDSEPAKAKVSKRVVFNQYYDLVFNDSIDEPIYKQLYRCYEIFTFIETKKSLNDKALISHATFALIYTMKMLNHNILNENIPSDNIKTHFENSFTDSIVIINEIVNEKQKILESKFSLNNLFKNSEIKDLIDIKIEKVKKEQNV